jgi:transposase
MDGFRARAESIIKAQKVEDAISLDVTESISHEKKYAKKGRPTANGPYKMVEIRILHVDFKRREAEIEQFLNLAGWRIYVTNIPASRLTLNQSTRYYRNEWSVERGFHRFKRGSIPALPLYLRIAERIKGLMMLLTVALQALTSIEFVTRRELEERDETLQGLVPGLPKMKTARPTAERLLSVFDNLHLLIQDTGTALSGRVLESLTPVQSQILSVLKIPVSLYELCFSEPKILDSS